MDRTNPECKCNLSYCVPMRNSKASNGVSSVGLRSCKPGKLLLNEFKRTFSPRIKISLSNKRSQMKSSFVHSKQTTSVSENGNEKMFFKKRIEPKTV